MVQIAIVLNPWNNVATIFKQQFILDTERKYSNTPNFSQNIKIPINSTKSETLGVMEFFTAM